MNGPARCLSNKITRLTLPMLQNSLVTHWEELGVPVLRCAIELKLAHIHLETGLASCHNWNLGNIKSHPGDGQHWQYFACGEEIDASKLKSVQALGPGLVDVKKRYLKGGKPWVSIWLRVPSDPKVAPHPWTKFAAFETIDDGLARQFTYLRTHPDVLAALQTGDPDTYNAALCKAEYFTANEAQYRAILRQRLAIVKRECASIDWGDVC